MPDLESSYLGLNPGLSFVNCVTVAKLLILSKALSFFSYTMGTKWYSFWRFAKKVKRDNPYEALKRGIAIGSAQ